jgi:transposase
MAKHYRPVERDQGFLLPPDMREWLPAGHPVWLVIRVVEQHLDTGALHAARRTGGAGAAGYDPDMLLTLLVWAYAHRVTSSRRIEALCGTDVAFRVICAGQVPDHVTIARFRAGLGSAAGALFDQVLVLCARLGMGQLGLVALDGMKIAASAGKSANRTEERLRELAAAIAAEHERTDAAEDALFGPGVRGDEVDPELADPRTRDQRIAAALAGLEAERQAAQAERDRLAGACLAKVAAGQPVCGHIPAEADVAAAQLRLEQALAAQQAKVGEFRRRQAAKIAATGAGLARRPPAPPDGGKHVKEAAAALDRARKRAAERERKTADKDKGKGGPGPVRNLTDPHSRLMPTRQGFIQGYNTQNLASSDGLILATRLTTSTTDTPWLAPMLAAAGRAAKLIAAHRPGGGEPIGLLLADAGYLSEANLTLDGPDRLIAVGKTRGLARAAADPRRSGGTARGPAVLAMAARLTTEPAIAAYKQRGHIAETPHGHIKHNMGFRQLSVRGLPRATAEWMLTATVHNLFKAITSGHLTTAPGHPHLTPQPDNTPPTRPARPRRRRADHRHPASTPTQSPPRKKTSGLSAKRQQPVPRQ